MKKLFIMAFGLLSIVSCTKENKQEVVSKNEEQPTVSHLSNVAKMMASVNIDGEDVKFVNSEVNKSLEIGLDEDCNFTNIMSPSVKSETSVLRDKIIQYYSSTKSSADESVLNDIESCKIYWPYSEDWDGVSTPVITFVPEDDKQDWNYAYKQVTVNGITSLESIVVNEEYAQNNPVWVIAIDEKEDIDKLLKTYDTPQKNSSINQTNDVLTKGSQDAKYLVTVDSFMSTEHHDSWLKGASEYTVIVTSAIDLSLNGNNSLVMTSVVKSFNVNLTRKDVNKGRWKYFNENVLVSYWAKNLSNIAVCIIEDDGGGGKVELVSKLSGEFEGVNYAFDVKFTVDKKDQNMGTSTYHREYLLPTNGGNTRSVTPYHGSGIRYTLTAKKHNW